jgi:predicted PurR-regulated permease PerM
MRRIAGTFGARAALCLWRRRGWAPGEASVREGRRPETIARVDEIPDLFPNDPLRQISTWSLAILAAIAAGFVLYLAREIVLPVVAAFIVGIMLGPAARRLEALRVPRPFAALLLVAGVTLIIAFVILLIVPKVSEVTNGLPDIVASLKGKLHVFDGLVRAWGRFTQMTGEPPKSDAIALPLPGISWVPSTISILLPPITGFLFFLVVLLLFIGAWPDLRRALVMRFASRDSRLTVLKILNEIEAGLANYLLIVTLINVGVGVLTGVICALTRMPNAIGFGALAATLNFVPIIGPIATFVVLLVVGFVAAPTLALGLLPAAGYAVLIVVEGQFVTPTIIGRHLELNALAVLLSLAFWTWLWGPMGAFLSSPILMVALIINQRLYGEEDR